MTAVMDRSYLDALEAADEPKPTGPPWPILLSKAPHYAEPKWLVRDFWPAGLLGLLVGDGGTFKSSLALHIAAAVAGGYEVFDRYQAVQQPVLVLSAEDREDVMRMRVEAFIRGHQWDYARVMEHFHVLAVPDPVLGSPLWRKHLHEVIAKLNIGFVVLDPWADLIDGDENANSEIRPVIKYLRELMAAGSCSVAVVHHMGKGGPDKRVVDRIRGATGLPHASRVIYAFEWHEGAVHVENVKMSRTEKVPTFVLDRLILSAPHNRQLWELARVVTKDAREYRDSEARRWIVRVVSKEPGIGTRELRRAREPGTPNNHDLQSALKSLVAEGYVTQTPGKQNKQHLNLTPSGTHFLSTFASVGPRGDAATSGAEGVESAPDLFETSHLESVPSDSRAHLGTVSGPSIESVPNRAQTVPGHTSGAGLGALRTTHPLKGVRVGATGEPPSTEIDDLRAQAEERAGLEEGL